MLRIIIVLLAPLVLRARESKNTFYIGIYLIKVIFAHVKFAHVKEQAQLGFPEIILLSLIICSQLGA